MEKSIDGTHFGTVKVKHGNNITGSYEVCPTKMQKLAASMAKSDEKHALRMPGSLTLPFS